MRSSSLPSMIIIFIFDHPAYLWWPPHDPACGGYPWDLPACLPLVASTWPGLWTTIPEIFQLTFGGLHMTQPVDDYSQDLPAYLWWPPLGLACGWHQPVHSSDRWSHPPAAGPSSPDKVPADTALHGPGSTAHL